MALQFAGSTRLTPSNDLTSFTASNLTFNSGAGAFVLSGNGLSLAGGITNSSSNLQTINLGLTLTADSTINTGASGITIGGSIDGGFGISKSGTGTLTLSTGNAYTGLTTVSAGTIVANHNQAFGTTDQGTTITTGAMITLGSGVTITGESLVLNGAGDNNGALRATTGDATWAGPVTLGSGTGSGAGTGGARLGSQGTGNLTVSGAITDGINDFDLVIRSATNVTGKVILSSTSNTYRHTYAVVGTLALGAENTLPTASNLYIGNTSNQGSALVDLNGFNQQVATLSSVQAASANTMSIRVTNSSLTAATMTIAAASDFGGTITGNLALTKSGSGTLALYDAGSNATNSYTGLTTIGTGGAISIQKATALGSIGSGTVVQSGGALHLSPTGTVSFSAEPLSIEGTGVSSNGALRAVSGVNTWSGAITMTAAAEIQVDSSASLLIDVSSGSAITGSATNLTLDIAGDLTIADPIATTTGTVTKNGAGTATLSGSGANTFTGLTTISTGTLILNKTAGVNALGSTAITLGNNSGGLDILRLGASDQMSNSATVTLAGSGATAGIFQLNGSSETISAISSSTTGAGIIENEGGGTSTLTLSATSGSHTFSGIIRDGDGLGTDGTLALAKSGASTLILSGANSYSSTTLVGSGTLQVFSNSALGAGDGTTTTGSSVTSGATLEISSGITVANEAVTINGQGVGNTGALRGTGGGTSTWNGPVILGSGTGTAGGARVGTSGTGTALVLGGQITDNGNGFDLVIRTDGSTGGKVVVSGAGNSYGSTYIVVGNLQLDGGDDRLSTTGLLSLGNTSSVSFAALDLNGRNQRIGGLTALKGTPAMSRTLTNASGSESVLTIQNSSSYSYDADLSGNLSLVKSGTGNQTLNGLNSYTGRTSVQQGTLILSGTATIASSSWIHVSQGAALQVSGLSGGGLTYSITGSNHPISGNGSLTGNLTISGEAFLAPGTTSDLSSVNTAGDGFGTLSVSGNLALTPSSVTTSVLDIFSASQADQISVGGSLTLSSNSHFQVLFRDGYVPNLGDSWALLDWATSLTSGGFSTGTNYRSGANSENNEGNLDLPELGTGRFWEISNFSGSGSLNVTVVPEPSRAILLLGGIMVLILHRRRF